MNEKGLKYIFLACSLVLLTIMLLLSRKAGISCDEVLHYGQSRAVYSYFATHGADKSALNTPSTNLKYYGQSFDNITTVIAKWTGIEDIYSFRHLMSTLAGWLAIFVTALIAIRLSGFKAGIFVILLFAISPVFLGHSQNNLKDVPFALGYISSIYFTFRVLNPGEGKVKLWEVILLVASMAFTISIRAGGLLVICYLFLFFVVSSAISLYSSGRLDKQEILRQAFLLVFASMAAFFLGILLWPFALQSPFRNVLESYHVMAHFPSTFREIFNGSREWSDFMPWYYLPGYMLITIPFIVLAGPVMFIMLIWKGREREKWTEWIFLGFTFLFPIFFAIINRSNIYSGWRQFLFIFPPLVVFSAAGFSLLLERIKQKSLKWLLVFIIAIASVGPVKYIARNPAFLYIYFNQSVGGLKGAEGKYETDYYYIGQTLAADWLKAHLDSLGTDKATVMATYPVDWQFRTMPGVRTFYSRYEERSQSDWDYAIVSSRYVEPSRLGKRRSWPTNEAIHVVYADKVPVCAVLKRRTHDDFIGYSELEQGNADKAIESFRKALKLNCNDELIFYNFARALRGKGMDQEADSALARGLEINPVCETILMYCGQTALEKKEYPNAEKYFSRLLEVNRKYFGAYVGLAEAVKNKDILKARELLRNCLVINPKYITAIEALADTYRNSSPDVAKKYDELATSIRNINNR